MSKLSQWTEGVRQGSEQRSRQRTRRMARRFPGWRNRRHRRPLAVIVILGLVATLLAVFLDMPGSEWWVPVFLLGVAPWWLLLRVLTAGLAERMALGFDERERALRDRYAYAGWWLAQAFMMVMFVYWTMAIELDAPDLQARGPALLFTSFAVAAAVPTLRLAWNLPDEDPEDLGGDHG